MGKGTGEVLKAIKARYDDQLKSSQFSDQDIALGLAKDSASFPYVVMSVIGDVSIGWSTSGANGGTEFRLTSMQFTIFDDDVATIVAKQDALHTAFDFAPLVASDTSRFTECRRMSSLIMHGDVERTRDVQDKQIYQAVSTYDIRRSVEATFSPS